MRCFHPILINRNDPENCREVPCGKCPACRRNYQLQWIIRLVEELKHSEAGFFVTLTYSDENEPGFDKPRVQKFLNRLQHRAKYRGSILKYFLVSEYGDTTGRPHHHALFFLDKYLDDFSNYIAKCWQFGFITISDINGARINYVTGYCLKKFNVDWSDLPDRLNPDKCRLISKGLGVGYLSDRIKKYHKDGLVTQYSLAGQYGSSLPRYYKEKIFDAEELEQIKSTNRCYDEQVYTAILRKCGMDFFRDFNGKIRESKYISKPYSVWLNREFRRRQELEERWSKARIRPHKKL